MKKIKIGCRISPEIYKKVKELAEKERWSMSKVAEVAVEKYLKLRGFFENETK